MEQIRSLEKGGNSLETIKTQFMYNKALNSSEIPSSLLHLSESLAQCELAALTYPQIV